MAIDRIETLLLEYTEDLTRLANGVASNDEAPIDELASSLQQKKVAMVAAVKNLTFLDRGADVLMQDLKAWEGLAKNAAKRSLAAEQAVKQAENAIRLAIEELRKEDSEVSS